ncbi:MAG: glycosyltransferase [Microgenomates group bacterium]
MKIGVDGGSLCQKNYTGNKVFTENLLKSLALYDKKNYYHVFTYCQKNIYFGENIKICQIQPKFGWSKISLSLNQLIHPNDIFLALNQSIPFLTPKKVISFCHGLSYFFYPQFYPDSFHQLKSQLKKMIKVSDYIVVSSKKVKRELLSVFEKTERKIIILPFGIPYDMFGEVEFKNREKFFLFVGVNHPIKNIDFIKKVFKNFKKEAKDDNWQLVLVTKNYRRAALKSLYQKATALLCASYYESFNFPALEALSLGCPVITLKTAIIPEMEEFVYIAKNMSEFVKLMKEVAENRKMINKQKIKKIKKKFNWQDYVFKLKQLY